jgi:cytochrome c-type biogenesis protein CcmH
MSRIFCSIRETLRPRFRGGSGAVLRAMILLLMMFTTPAFAVLPSEMLKDPALEARARVLSEELRCLVCQNQSIDDSEAPLAADLRVLLRQRLSAGDTDEQVLDYLVARYGEFILLKPRFNWHTALLWAAPPLVLVAGMLAALAAWRRRAGEKPLPPLGEDEEKALRRLTSGDDANITES